MKKLISSFLVATLLLFSTNLWAPILPIGIDSTTGQQKVGAGTIYTSSSGVFAELSQPGQTSNCGISNSGTTFTIAGKDGSSLSTEKPCAVAINSNTAGRSVVAVFTSNVTFTHGAASDTDGNLFGITDANWASTMPFFLGVVYDGTTPLFTISRLPYKVTGAAAADICQKGDIDCDAQRDMMLLTTGATIASWVGLPVTQVGFFNMTYATTGGAWTAAVALPNGFNNEYEKIYFGYPTGQNMAATGTHWLANGGTAPLWSSNDYEYIVYENGEITAHAFLTGDPGTDGAGAVNSKLSLPFLIVTGSASDTIYQYIGTSNGATTITGTAPTIGAFIDGVGDIQPNYFPTSSTTSGITNAMFSNGARTVNYQFTYSAMPR